MNRNIISSYEPLPESQYPLSFIRHNGAVILAETSNQITIGITKPENNQLKMLLQNYHNPLEEKEKPVKFVQVSDSELAIFLSSLQYQERQPLQTRETEDFDLLDQMANEAPIIQLVNTIILEAVQSSASDAHIECTSKDISIRFRINGILKESRRISKSLLPGISARIKIMSNLDIMERRLPQDGRISTSLANRNLDIRVSIIPSCQGESIVLRMLYHDKAYNLEQLGITQQQIDKIENISEMSSGLILVIGSTGSGKTTTMHAILQHIAKGNRKILTIEDPVEYRLEGASQIQVNESIELGFANILKRILRHDPEVIMIGEIRDSKTAGIALQAALTGHLVISSLHANCSRSAEARICSLGVNKLQLSYALKATIYQKLVNHDSTRAAKMEITIYPDLKNLPIRGGHIAQFEN